MGQGVVQQSVLAGPWGAELQGAHVLPGGAHGAPLCRGRPASAGRAASRFSCRSRVRPGYSRVRECAVPGIGGGRGHAGPTGPLSSIQLTAGVSPGPRGLKDSPSLLPPARALAPCGTAALPGVLQATSSQPWPRVGTRAAASGHSGCSHGPLPPTPAELLPSEPEFAWGTLRRWRQASRNRQSWWGGSLRGGAEPACALGVRSPSFEPGARTPQSQSTGSPCHWPPALGSPPEFLGAGPSPGYEPSPGRVGGPGATAGLRWAASVDPKRARALVRCQAGSGCR